ncbi:MAG: hypothetical protein JOY62_03435 [Acidobacteriaceae bacterium]|nr:hypothetical protein [Acidobacteriaceae bacterium]MBV9779004.1 hypothetical protein [Acidobacteriaceae bacterium]
MKSKIWIATLCLLAGFTVHAQTTVTTTGGTANIVAKYSGSSTIVNSLLFDNGSSVALGTTSPTATFHIATPETASKPGLLLSGSWFTGGTASTNLPELLIQPAGATSNNWSSSGTALGINASSTFKGYFIVTQLNGANRFYVSSGGGVGANYIANPVSLNYVELAMGTTGAVMSRNIADSHPALIVQQQNASSTGDILDLKSSSSTLLVVQHGGNVGIGTTSPSSLLTVAGSIRSTSGGFTFPDNTVQTTAAVSGLSAVSHDGTLTGAGTGASPLGINVPLSLTSSFTTLSVASTGAGYYGAAVSGGPSAIGIWAAGGATDGTGEPGPGTYFLGGQGNASIGGASGAQGQGGTGSIGGDGVDGFGGSGISDQGGYGIYGAGGQNADGSCCYFAGYFDGDVYVNGNVDKSGGSFKIDHPLDPANKYLYHSFVESPDMKNIYDGNVITDGSGFATVTLPEWFEVLNRDFRYQLTVIGQFAQAIIAKEIDNHQFTIRTDKPNVKVSWQVTGIRQDAWANAHRIPVEEEKSERARGHYLHPELYNEPPERSELYAERPDLMRKLAERRKPR